MTTSSAVGFGEVLRRYRVAAGLTQEALAQRAGLSGDAVRALERGRRGTPRTDTLSALAAALDLDAADRATFEAAATAHHALADAGAARPVAAAVPSTVSAPPDVLIGREREVTAVTHLLRQGATRLLTLTGPGGVGKTRLALAAAATLHHAYPDGVVFVDLAPLHDAELVLPTIAQALGVREAGTHEVGDLLLRALDTRRLLIVLDNVEHIIAAAPLVAQLVAACPTLVVVATSRTALRVRAEQQFVVQPLRPPDPASFGRLDAVARSAAVQLFVARARAAQPAFQLDAANAAAVAQICARLDGLPLALELAASWIRLLPPAALLGRLERRLSVLTGGACDLPVRQRTLRDTLAWSYDLLSATEQRLFGRLAVFQGGRTLEAIEAVCDLEGDGALMPGNGLYGGADVLAGVEALLDKSLLRLEEADGVPRVVMLETIHEYARERLDVSGEGPELRRRHAAYFVALAERGAAAVQGAEQETWLAELEREHDNLRAALRWAEEAGAVRLGVQLAGALAPFWHIHGHLGEGRRWLERLLAQAGGADDMDSVAWRARALAGAGWLAHRQNDFAAAAALLEESVALHRMLGHGTGIADVLINRGLVAHAQGDYDCASKLLEEGLALHRAQGERVGIGGALVRLAVITREQGAYERATTLYEEALRLFRELEDHDGIAVALLGLGDIARDRGEPAEIEAWCAESLTLFRALGERWGIACSLNNLGWAAYYHGALSEATSLLEDSLALFRELGIGGSIAEELVGLGRVVAARDEHERAAGLLAAGLRLAWSAGPRWLVAAALEGLATLEAAHGQGERATQDMAAASTLRATMGAPRWPADRAPFDRTVAALRRQLGEDAFAVAWAQGEERPLEQIVTAALGQADVP